ncbi:MAG: MerR family transcriptional regulator [Bacilli bacterium]
MKDKVTQFTIAQFAKLHNINKRTLHYYDKIDLFSPQYKGDNNYRYYDYKQSVELEYILMLKELDLSIDEIKHYLRNPNEDDFMRIISLKDEELENEMKRITNVQNILKKKKDQLLLCESIKNKRIDIIECGNEYLMTTSNSGINYELNDILIHLKETWKNEQYRLGCGMFISIEKIKARQFGEYDGIFTPINKYSSEDNLMLKPKGSYICGYLVGNLNKLPEFYDEILCYAQDKHLELTGYSYQIGLNEFMISETKDYITKIMVKIKAD